MQTLLYGEVNTHSHCTIHYSGQIIESSHNNIDGYSEIYRIPSPLTDIVKSMESNVRSLCSKQCQDPDSAFLKAQAVKPKDRHQDIAHQKYSTKGLPSSQCTISLYTSNTLAPNDRTRSISYIKMTRCTTR